LVVRSIKDLICAFIHYSSIHFSSVTESAFIDFILLLGSLC